MTTVLSVRPKKNIQGLTKQAVLKTGIFGFAMAALGFVAALAVMLPLMHPQPARIQVMQPKLASAVSTTECAQATLPPAQPPASPPAAPQPPATFVTRLIKGDLHVQAAISQTGPGSTNTIVAKTETTTHVTNVNHIDAAVSNDQQVGSGNATVSENTSGGSASSGQAVAANTSNFSIIISN